LANACQSHDEDDTVDSKERYEWVEEDEKVEAGMQWKERMLMENESNSKDYYDTVAADTDQLDDLRSNYFREKMMMKRTCNSGSDMNKGFHKKMHTDQEISADDGSVLQLVVVMSR